MGLCRASEQAERTSREFGGDGINDRKFTSAQVGRNMSLANKETAAQETPCFPVGREPSGNRHVNFVFS